MLFAMEAKVENIDGIDSYTLIMKARGTTKEISMSIDCSRDEKFVLTAIEKLYLSCKHGE